MGGVVAVFLASDLAKDVTGRLIGVGGGRIYAFVVRGSAGASKGRNLDA